MSLYTALLKIFFHFIVILTLMGMFSLINGKFYFTKKTKVKPRACIMVIR